MFLCNILPLRGWTHLHLAAFLGDSLSSQNHTSLFCTLCPHSCAPRKDFPVGHPFWNCSRPSMLNLRVLWKWTSEKKLQLIGMRILLILLSSGLGWYILTPLRDRRHPLKRPTSSSVNPKSGTSPLGHVCVSSANVCTMLYDHSGSTLAKRTIHAQLRYTRPWNRESRLRCHSVLSYLYKARPASSGSFSRT
jgi:hypothetical protein